LAHLPRDGYRTVPPRAGPPGRRSPLGARTPTSPASSARATAGRPAAFENLTAALERGGATWADVFKLTDYIVDTAHLPTVRAVRDEFIDTDRPPTSTLVRVAGLFRDDLLIEIEAVAAV